MHNAFFFDQAKMLAYSIGTFESKMVRRLLERRENPSLPLFVSKKLEDLLLPGCKLLRSSHLPA